ncbi:hypothetical protein Klosneuvirus_1_373 [Klosneuvirus KNV1]|uniref:Uncharacterized protein n=1 Tax=Klosneuvirus KNV1 TaxID=1977640 RepID=A0A1V0SIG1_9VIRU|nr:hypothetical protein Klosneuvirus_1_373 [Klosneuvirus KNV1]
MSSNIDNESMENQVIMTESDKDNELLKNQQSEASPNIVEPMEEVIARRTEMIMTTQEEVPKSFWHKYKVIIILLIVVVLIGVGVGIYLYMESKHELSSDVKVESGEAIKILKVESEIPSTTSPAVTETLKSPSPGVEAASPSPTSANADVSPKNLSATSSGPAVEVAPKIPGAEEAKQVGGWYNSINSSSASLTSDVPFLSLFRF